MMRCLITTGLLISTVMAALLTQEEKKQDPQQEEPGIVIPTDDNRVARRDFMRTKLLFSQNILEGLTTGNFELMKSALDEVSGITEAEQWVAIDNEQYRKLTDDFKTSIKRLEAATESGNIEAAAFRYYQMSTSCIDCHLHIRQASYEL